jgi:hypothetical protein
LPSRSPPGPAPCSLEQKSVRPGRQLTACGRANNPSKHPRLFFETASFSEFPTSQSGSSYGLHRRYAIGHHWPSQGIAFEKPLLRLGTMDSCIGSAASRGADELDLPCRAHLIGADRDYWPICAMSRRAACSPAEAAILMLNEAHAYSGIAGISRGSLFATRAAAPIACHTFRARGISAYLSNGSTLEQARWRRTKPARDQALRPDAGRLTREEVELIVCRPAHGAALHKNARDHRLTGEPADLSPLGVGEASGGPTVAAIGNTVAHALGLSRFGLSRYGNYRRPLPTASSGDDARCGQGADYRSQSVPSSSRTRSA